MTWLAKWAVFRERRAKRRRDFRWFQPIVGRIELRLFNDDQQLLDAAVALQPLQRITVPDLICDVAVDADLSTAYVGLFDQTVRAYDLASTEENWHVDVIGGAQLDLVTNASARPLSCMPRNLR